MRTVQQNTLPLFKTLFISEQISKQFYGSYRLSSRPFYTRITAIFIVYIMYYYAGHV